MKRILIVLTAAFALQACTSAPKDVIFDKSTVEFLGNAFSDFALGDDLTVFLTQNPQDQEKWSIQATVPVKKVSSEAVDSLTLDIIPVDERGVNVDDSLFFQAQDLENLIPVFNSADSTAKTIVFKSNKEFTRKEADAILEKAENLKMAFNKLQSQQTIAEEKEAEEAEAKKKEKPTLGSLCEQYGVYGMLGQYDKLLKKGDKRAAKKVEDRLWEIEKKVMADNSLPESLRKQFKNYIEDREDQIEDKY